MAENPLISIIVPVYQVEAYVEECINSIIQQAYQNFECLIIDDGCTDQSIAIVERCTTGNSRFRIIRQPNKGLAAARNTGLKHANGELVAFLDADDFWAPEKLQQQLQVFQKNPETDLVFTNFYKVRFGHPLIAVHKNPYAGNPYELLAVNNVVGSGSSVLAKRSALKKAGEFNDSLSSFEDLEYWFRCAVNGLVFRFDPTPAVFIRWRPDSLQRNKAKMRDNNIKAFDFQLKTARQRGFKLFKVLKFSWIRIQGSRKYFDAGAPLRNIFFIFRMGWVVLKNGVSFIV